jgi:hypothetical protein
VRFWPTRSFVWRLQTNPMIYVHIWSIEQNFIGLISWQPGRRHADGHRCFYIHNLRFREYYIPELILSRGIYEMNDTTVVHALTDSRDMCSRSASEMKLGLDIKQLL